MKHRLYEGWIVARDDLSPDQERELQLHLENCEQCTVFAQAEQAVDRMFTSVHMLEPMPGFTQRWRSRASEKRHQAHRRQTSYVLGLLTLGASVFLMPIVLQVLLLLISPENLLFDYAKGTVAWLAWFEFVGEFLMTFVNVLISTIPVVGWLTLAVAIAGVCALWGFSLRRLVFLQRRKGV